MEDEDMRPAAMLRRVDFDTGVEPVEAADRLAQDYVRVMTERDNAVAALGALTTERDRLYEETEAVKHDRAWEANRANEAARLSADARDRADDLARQIEKLQEQVAAVESDRTSRDAWAVRVGIRYDLSYELDPYEAISRHLQKVVAQRNDYMADLAAKIVERDAARALLVEEQQAHAATWARCDALLPVVAAAAAFVTDEDPSAAQIDALVRAVDVMPWSAYRPDAATPDPEVTDDPA